MDTNQIIAPQIVAPLDEARVPQMNAWRLYKAFEAAELLGFPDPREGNKAIYHIPDCDLPRRYVGPNKGSLRFLGADLMTYMLGLPPLDLSSEVDKLRQALRPPAKPKPLHAKRSRLL